MNVPGFEIRPARPEELRLVVDSWGKTFAPRHRDAEPTGAGMGHPWGSGRFVTSATARAMLAGYIGRCATVENVMVCAVEGEAMGWVCRELLGDLALVHCVYVVRQARREGLGRMLVDYVQREATTAGVELQPAAMNGPGLRVWEGKKRR